MLAAKEMVLPAGSAILPSNWVVPRLKPANTGRFGVFLCGCSQGRACTKMTAGCCRQPFLLLKACLLVTAQQGLVAALSGLPLLAVTQGVGRSGCVAQKVNTASGWFQ